MAVEPPIVRKKYFILYYLNGVTQKKLSEID